MHLRERRQRAGGWHSISSWVRIRKVGGSLKPSPSTFFSTALWSFLWRLLRKGRRVPRMCKLLEKSRPQLHQSVSANFSLCWWETCCVDWNRKWAKAKVSQEPFLCALSVPLFVLGNAFHNCVWGQSISGPKCGLLEFLSHIILPVGLCLPSMWVSRWGYI